MKNGCIGESVRAERLQVAGDQAIEVRTEVRAGGLSYNHSQSIHRAG